MSLVIQIPVKYEDRFAIAIRDLKANDTKFSKITIVDVERESSIWIEGNYYPTIEFYIELNPYTYNKFFHKLNDIEQIMDIPIKFRYVRNISEAYTGVDKQEMFEHLWLEIARN